MKKLEIEVYFDGSSIEIANEQFVLERCREIFRPGYLDATIKNPFAWKSNEQMGYFFAAVAGSVHAFMGESGYKFSNKLQSLYYLMENMPTETGFGLSDKWCDISYGPNGNVVKRSAMPISVMGRSDLHELATDLTAFLNDMGIEVPSVEDFKKNSCSL